MDFLCYLPSQYSSCCCFLCLLTCLAVHPGMSPDAFPHWTQVVFKLEKWKHLRMLTWLSRKVRRLPIIISFSLMRCLSSLPKVIPCTSKCIIWSELDATPMELEENRNLRGRRQRGRGGCFSASIQNDV